MYFRHWLKYVDVVSAAAWRIAPSGVIIWQSSFLRSTQMSLDHAEVRRELQKAKTKIDNLLNYIDTNRLEPDRASIDAEICSQLKNISSQVVLGKFEQLIKEQLTSTYVFTVKFFDADKNVLWSGSASADHHEKAMDIIESMFEDTDLVSRWSGQCEVEYPDDYESPDGW